MPSFCKHTKHHVISNIWEPRYHDKKVLINVNHIQKGVEHFLLKFQKAPAYPKWYYLSRRSITKRAKQKNGNGLMYVVPLSELQDFTPLKECEHNI